MIVPLLFALPRRLRIPAVVGELVAGMILGKSGLGWIAEHGPYLDFLFAFGLAFVLFSCGNGDRPGKRHQRIQERLAARIAVATVAVRCRVGYQPRAGIFSNDPALDARP